MFAYCNNIPVILGDFSGTAAVHCIAYTYGGGSPLDDTVAPLRDVTEEIADVLSNAAFNARIRRSTADIAFYSSGRVDYIVSIYLEFYSLVNHGATWDIKREHVWEDTIGTSYPGFDTAVLFCGMVMTPESLGNFTYGYLGCAYGIPLDQLIAGSYYAAGFPIDRSGLNNEMGDWAYVALGYTYAEKRHFEGGI